MPNCRLRQRALSPLELLKPAIRFVTFHRSFSKKLLSETEIRRRQYTAIRYLGTSLTLLAISDNHSPIIANCRLPIADSCPIRFRGSCKTQILVAWSQYHSRYVSVGVNSWIFFLRRRTIHESTRNDVEVPKGW